MSGHFYYFVAHYYLEIAFIAMVFGGTLRFLLRRHCEWRGLADYLTMTGNSLLLMALCFLPMQSLIFMPVSIFCCACGGFLMAGVFVAMLAGN